MPLIYHTAKLLSRRPPILGQACISVALQVGTGVTYQEAHTSASASVFGPNVSSRHGLTQLWASFVTTCLLRMHSFPSACACCLRMTHAQAHEEDGHLDLG